MKKTMLFSTLLLTGTGIVSQVTGFLYRIILSRMIGAEVMGLYQLIMPAYSVMMSLTAVGLTVAVSTLSSHYRALGRENAVRRNLCLCLVALILLFAGVAAVTVFNSDAISVNLLGDARTQLGLLILLPCVLLTGIENLHKHYFYGTGRVVPPAVTEILEQFIRAIAVLGLLVLLLPQNPERTVGIIVLGMTLCEIFSATTLVCIYQRERSGRPIVPSDGETVKAAQIAKIAIPVGATALLGNLMSAATAVLIPRLLVTAGEDASQAMSAFGVLCGMTLPMLLLPSAFLWAISLVLVPALAGADALGRKGETRRLTGQAILATSILLLPAMSLLTVLGPGVGVLLFREDTVGQFIAPLALGVTLGGYQGVLASILNGVGKQSWAAKNAIICGGVQLLITAVTTGVPGVGLRGYVAGYIVSAVLGLLLNLVAVVRTTGLKLCIFSWLTAPGLASLLMALCVRLLLNVLVQGGVSFSAAALSCLLFGVVLYGAALHAQGVSVRQVFHEL